MLEKLKAIEERLAEVERLLFDPAVYGDRDRLTALSREQKELTPVVACYRAYLRAQDTAREAEEMLSDPELRALAQEELAGARADMERLQEELKRLLLPRDPNDEKNVIWRYGAVSAARRARCSPPTCCGCTPCTPSAGAGTLEHRQRERDGAGRREGGQLPGGGRGRVVAG